MSFSWPEKKKARRHFYPGICVFWWSDKHRCGIIITRRVKDQLASSGVAIHGPWPDPRWWGWDKSCKHLLLVWSLAIYVTCWIYYYLWFSAWWQSFGKIVWQQSFIGYLWIWAILGRHWFSVLMILSCWESSATRTWILRLVIGIYFYRSWCSNTFRLIGYRFQSNLKTVIMMKLDKFGE